jgi:hypothetical protein
LRKYDYPSGGSLYCNGLHCHKTVRVAETPSKRGYTNIKKYQLGLPVWRAFGKAAETSLSGFKQIYSLDKTAVIVDARNQELYNAIKKSLISINGFNRNPEYSALLIYKQV